MCHWLRLRAANGLETPYIGYLEVDVQVLDKQIPKRGVLVIKDTPDASPDPEVCGVLGINAIRECFKELFLEHGPALFDLPPSQAKPSAKGFAVLSQSPTPARTTSLWPSQS